MESGRIGFPKIALDANNRLPYAYHGLSRIALATGSDRLAGATEARRLAAIASNLTEHEDLDLLAHYAKTIVIGGDIELARKLALEALSQVEDGIGSELGREIMSILELCRMDPPKPTRRDAPEDEVKPQRADPASPDL